MVCPKERAGPPPNRAFLGAASTRKADGSILLGANFDATLDEVQAFLASAEEAEKLVQRSDFRR